MRGREEQEAAAAAVSYRVLIPYRRIMNHSGWIVKCGGEMKVKLGVLVLFCCEFIRVFSSEKSKPIPVYRVEFS
jgi:hypothetical protein